MATQPPRTSARLWRWLIAGVLLAALLAVYWIALQRLGAHLGDGVEQALRPVPALDQHTPSVN